ncbi:type VII secretion-associated protein [Mycolicibacterium sp. CBMA 226]|uniref:type VII secretion-associated protein n=1 Tax=Mycolicibacterium sp. CBMA 226 TaxID=2606611 RepID=UPI0012DF8225|nr:type VII secretion-associated protein [Mycolicibacterium sp. CBMA 226]MUL77287.1 type VII secretion-associated protein [Mycolicibacterium sp. CBMA 226]
MTVVVVGPATISGPGEIDAELVSSALECVGEQLGLLDGTVLPADRIWRAAMSAAIGTVPAVTVVCPTWWPPSRVDRVLAAARHHVPHVVVRRRTEALRAAADESDCVVVELDDDLVTISQVGASSVVRRNQSGIADAAVALIPEDTHVAIDAPIGVPGAPALATEIQALLRDRGLTSQILRCDDLLEGADVSGTPTAAGPHRGRARIAIAATATMVVLGALGLGLSSRHGPAPGVAATAEPDLTWLVEGRVAMQVPAHWTVDRALAAGGSARVQIISPDDRGQIIHLTQSQIPRGQTLDVTARALREAATKLPDGVIVDFQEAGVSAGRAAVRYREVRGGRTVEWSVLLDGPVRIAVGCQGTSVQPVCDSAIRSAHRTD